MDADKFRDVLRRHGAELVLHGHDHIHSLVMLDGPSKKIPAVGVPSASAIGGEGGTPVPADKISDYFAELESKGIACLGCFLNGWTPRVGESQQARHLVESLACSVVEGCPKTLVLQVRFHEVQFSMASRDQQGDERKTWFRRRRFVGTVEPS